MAFELTSLTQLSAAGFDEIIDVRSPSEWAEDRLPGAINLPVLDDAERARVGTIYVQESHFLARKIGAALVARNAARHLETALADRPAKYRPLVYCWRGGQRSGSFSLILSQVGWRAEVLAGGYRTWRRLVKERVYDLPFPSPVVVIDGNTGTAKTELLAHLSRIGHQVIDLEALANHRGSLFGQRPGGQPAQKAFEGALAVKIAGLDPARAVFVEAESSKIGDRVIPPALWAAMCAAPRIEIAAPLAMRATYLARAYADISADQALLTGIVEKLRHGHPREVVEEWLALARDGQMQALAAGLMQHHYDPRYAKVRARREGPGVQIAADALEESALPGLAARIVAAASRLSPSP